MHSLAMQSLLFKRVHPYEKELLQKIYRLRFEVYGDQCGFIRKEDFPDGIETDEFDETSIHFAAVKPDGEVLGTLRLILPTHKKLPVQRHVRFFLPHDENLENIYCAEISRFMISKKLRRDLTKKDWEAQKKNEATLLKEAKNIFMGLCLEAYKECNNLGITHVFSLMEKGLHVLLRFYGFHFQCVGEEIDIYGPVRPYVATLSSLGKSLAKEFPRPLSSKKSFIIKDPLLN
jgi:N-acyl amino acid synthase of PEP-CTERM/exosortase system